MEEVGILAFLGVLELATVALAAGVFLLLRGNRLSREVHALEGKLKETVDSPEHISFGQYLRDAVIRNEGLIDQAAASGDGSEKKAAELLKLRKRFLEIELEAHALEGNPVAFQDRIAAGICELMEMMRPEAETIETEAEPAATAVELQEAPDDDVETEAKRNTIDTSEDELNHLKNVINNQQDAMALLRAQLEEHSDEVEGMDSVLQRLDDFEKQSTELERCLLVLESENERLKSAQAEDGQVAKKIVPADPAQLTGLKNMVGSQQETISGLRDLIGEIMPEADKARQLEEALDKIQHTNEELSGCVSVLEDENSMLRNELEMIGRQLDEQEAQRESEASVAQEAAADEPESTSHSEQIREMEIKVQELEALVEFKDATIEELEKQYHTLEIKYQAASGEQNVE